jgi:SAM-dependent methyltransferase
LRTLRQVTAAAQVWAQELAAWRIDPALLASVEESPYTLPPELFTPDEEPGDTPSRQRAIEALPDGGSVLDVGCGAGAASLALVPPAAHVTGVDASEGMLAAFEAAARDRGVAHAVVQGAWPDVADQVEPADVVVCHHVAYNVPDLAAFATALAAHARRRVVMELTAAHPWVPIGPLWRHFHGEGRPIGPTAALAADVLYDAGIRAHEEVWEKPRRALDRDLVVEMTRRRLCLPPGRQKEVDELLGPGPELTVREVVTLWWDT